MIIDGKGDSVMRNAGFLSDNRRVVIIGAGYVGSSIAYALTINVEGQRRSLGYTTWDSLYGKCFCQGWGLR